MAPPPARSPRTALLSFANPTARRGVGHCRFALATTEAARGRPLDAVAGAALSNPFDRVRPRSCFGSRSGRPRVAWVRCGLHRLRMPARGVCEITRPFLTWLERVFLTVPTAQLASLIAFFAAASFFAFTFGTRCRRASRGRSERPARRTGRMLAPRNTRRAPRGATIASSSVRHAPRLCSGVGTSVPIGACTGSAASAFSPYLPGFQGGGAAVRSCRGAFASLVGDQDPREEVGQCLVSVEWEVV